MKVIKSEIEKSEGQKLADKIKVQSTAVKAKESATMQKELLSSGLKGTARSNMEKKLKTQMSVRITDLTAKLRKTETAKSKAKVTAKVAEKIAAKKAEIEKRLASTIAKLTK